MIKKGEKVFIITRRLFNEDLRRHFVGEVQEISNVAIRVQGYVFVFDTTTNQFVRHEELRTRIFSLIDAGLVINLLPQEVRLADIRYKWDENNRRILSDEKTFDLNISEFSLDR